MFLYVEAVRSYTPCVGLATVGHGSFSVVKV